MKRIYCAAAVLLAMAGPAAGAPLALEGAGTAKCSTFLKFDPGASDNGELVFFSWVQGYMSGVNEASMRAGGRGHDLSSMSSDDEQEFLHDYCAAHPSDDVASAAAGLYETMRPTRNTP